jgi:hypothetical protein
MKSYQYKLYIKVVELDMINNFVVDNFLFNIFRLTNIHFFEEPRRLT